MLGALAQTSVVVAKDLAAEAMKSWGAKLPILSNQIPRGPLVRQLSAGNGTAPASMFPAIWFVLQRAAHAHAHTQRPTFN